MEQLVSMVLIRIVAIVWLVIPEVFAKLVSYGQYKKYLKIYEEFKYISFKSLSQYN